MTRTRGSGGSGRVTVSDPTVATVPGPERGEQVVDPIGPLPTGLHRDQLVAEVERALRPVPAGEGALIAVSGGADSTALAHLVTEARPDLRVTLGHVRHGLRDDEADLASVRWCAGALGTALEVVGVRVVTSGKGLEAAARDARYAALRRLARKVDASWLLLGHTADDQAETVLLRIGRGTGVDGLGGMAPFDGDRLRPLLRLRRAEVHRFIDGDGLVSAEDPMNLDPAFRRVRVRHQVLPALTSVSADPVGALCRLADLARADRAWMDDEAATLAAKVMRRYGPVAVLPAEVLAAHAEGARRRLIRHLLATVRAGEQPVDADHVESVLALRPGSGVDVPGAAVTLGGGWFAASPTGIEPPEPPSARPLQVPGRTPWPAVGVEIVADTAAQDVEGQLRMPLDVAWEPPRTAVPVTAIPPGGDVAFGQVVLGLPGSRLLARPRRPGDRIGTGRGTRKLQDVMVDAGIPRPLRDLLPVVVEERSDRPVWVPGVAVDEQAAAAGHERPAVHLALTVHGRGRR
jgi:tRNA(Ile)-lysidine synthase